MNQFQSGIAFGITAAAATLALALWRSKVLAARHHARHTPDEVTRWEGEGGNVHEDTSSGNAQEPGTGMSAAR
jgi:hypothetical protein